MKKKLLRDPMVQCFYSSDIHELNTDINEFLDNEKIETDHLIDIKWSTCVDDNNVYFSAMVVYCYDLEED
jgi:hypothetical protein